MKARNKKPSIQREKRSKYTVRDNDSMPLIIDFFEFVAFDSARQEAIQMRKFLRRMGNLSQPASIRRR